MPLHRHAVATLVALCLALGIAPAFAGKPQPTPLAPPSGPPVEVPHGSVSGTTTECSLGVVGPPTLSRAYLFAPDDAYYTLVDPAACDGCQGNNRVLTVAHVELNFAAPCEIPVTISIVPAIDLGGGCLAPNPLAPPVCEPTQYVIYDEGVTGQCRDYKLNLPGGCCIDGPVFLQIEFDRGSCADGQPMFCGPTTCSNCTQYNFFPGQATNGEDLCAVLPSGIKAFMMYVDSSCCSPTSTAPGSWGKLKTLYR